MKWEVNLRPVCWGFAVLGCCVAGVALGPCGTGPNDLKQCVVGGRLLAFGCLGSWPAKMRRAILWYCRRVSPSWAAGRPERRGDPMRLQTSESVLGSLLSGEARRGPAWLQTIESVLGSLLSGKARRGPAWLQTSVSVFGSLLSGEALRGPAWLQTSESVLGSRLSGEAWRSDKAAGE